MIMQNKSVVLKDNGYFGGIVTGRSHVGISGFWWCSVS